MRQLFTFIYSLAAFVSLVFSPTTFILANAFEEDVQLTPAAVCKALRFMHEFETCEMYYKYTPEQIDQNIKFVHCLTRTLVLPSQIAELEKDTLDLLQGRAESLAIVSQLSTEEKEQMLNALLDDIECIADKDYQRKSWIETNDQDEETETFDDFMIDLLENASLILIDYQTFGVTYEQCKALAEFYHAVMEFPDQEMKLEVFIDTPAWNHIIQLAQAVLQTFD